MKAIFLDIETTGLDPYLQHPIDIALKVVDLASGCCVGEYQSLVTLSKEKWVKHDPVSLEVNGYTWDEISQGKDIDAIKSEIIALFQSLNLQRGQAFFICQNPAFDKAFFIQIIGVYIQESLGWPYHWLDLASMYWAILCKECAEQHKSIPENISLSKNAIGRLYGLQEEASPHRAMQGVNHLLACYQALFPAAS